MRCSYAAFLKAAKNKPPPCYYTIYLYYTPILCYVYALVFLFCFVVLYWYIPSLCLFFYLFFYLCFYFLFMFKKNTHTIRLKAYMKHFKKAVIFFIKLPIFAHTVICLCPYTFLSAFAYFIYFYLDAFSFF